MAQQKLEEGQVLAPVAGRVLTVPFTKGTVVLNGDTIATIGEEPFCLRLRLPERHAVVLKAGDTCPSRPRTSWAPNPALTGTITLVYPQIEEGRVVADANGGRPRQLLRRRSRARVDQRRRRGRAYVIPENFVETRFGLDYVRAKAGRRRHRRDAGAARREAPHTDAAGRA